MHTESKLTNGKIDYLDGMRGIAAIFVIFSHCFLWFAPQMHTGIDLHGLKEQLIFNSPFTFFFKGGSAVTLFFVLSGYVLAKSCMSSNSPSEYILSAAKRRYIRLGIPVFASIVISYLLTHMGAFRAESLGSYSALSHKYVEQLPFVHFIFDSLIGGMIYGNGDFNYVLWTINIEFFGSLFVYATMAVFYKDMKSLRVFSISAAILLMTSQTDFIVYQSMFFYGCFLATFRINEVNSNKYALFAPAIMMFIGLYLQGFSAFSWRSISYSFLVDITNGINKLIGRDFLWNIIIPSVGSILIISCISINANIFKWLSKKVFRFYGRISFSLYLLHSFVLAIVAPWIYRLSGNGLLSAAIASLVVLIITTLVSIPFFKYIDRGAIRISKKIIPSSPKQQLEVG
ncbi:acyltransferase family protein [Pantoea stewartii subsp. indologenes]|uniref:acyltransferase family protein n=1 Tax=Pantoea stewartii TaxID=66269 RepID=UPI003FA4D195